MIEQAPDNLELQKSLIISGSDATIFLQGQLTCDVKTLANGKSTLGAYCNIKGKIESLFYLYKIDDEYILTMHPDLLLPTQNELQKYAVFSKVTLKIDSKSLPKRDLLTEIKQNIPCLYPETSNKFFPHDLNLPELKAVSFTKGCFRGQEIIARMQHRGKLARKMYLFKSDASLLVPGTNITTNNEQNAGTVVCMALDDNAKSTIGLAVISQKLLQEQLYLNNESITLVNL